MDYYEKTNLRDRAWALIGLKRSQDAVPLFAKALEFHPDDAYLLCGMSTAFYHLEEWEKSLDYAVKAILADPKEEWGHRRRSYCLVAMGRKEEALEAAQEAVRLAPKEGDCLLQLSCAQRKCGQLEAAEKTVQTLLEVAPDSASSHIELGLIHIEQKRHKEAEAANRKALELDPDSVTALVNLGVALSGLGQTQEELECYYRAILMDPTDKIALRNLQEQAEYSGFASIDEYLASRRDESLQARITQRNTLREKAQAFLRQGQFGQAIWVLNQALTITPDDLGLLALQAEAFARQSDYTNAVRVTDRAIWVNPKDWRAYRWRGWALLKMSEQAYAQKSRLQQDALAAASEAVKLSQENAGALETLSIIQRDLARYAEAEQTAKRLIEVSPQWWCSYQALARVYSRQEQWRVAEMYYRKAVELSPDCAEAINDIGLALSNQNRKKEALEYFQQASALEPANPTYRDNVRLLTPKKFFGLW